jgi:glucokinase
MLLGIEITLREVAVIVARDGGGAEVALRAPLPRVGGANANWLAALEVVREALLQSHLSVQQIQSAGIAFFAPLDENGLVRKDARSAGWENFDLRRALREHLGIENVSVQTRVICAAMAEHKLGALREIENGLLISLEHDVESAALASGVLLRGAANAALEIGAICLERDGELGASGRRGTLSAYCGAQSFMTRARSYGVTFQTPHEIWSNRDSNFMAKSLCDEYVERLAQGVGAVCAVLNPARIAFSGELFDAFGEELLVALRVSLGKYCLPVHARSLQIVAAALGRDAGVLGAVLLAQNHLAPDNEKKVFHD